MLPRPEVPHEAQALGDLVTGDNFALNSLVALVWTLADQPGAQLQNIGSENCGVCQWS
jgi:hypothetical protein